MIYCHRSYFAFVRGGGIQRSDHKIRMQRQNTRTETSSCALSTALSHSFYTRFFRSNIVSKTINIAIWHVIQCIERRTRNKLEYSYLRQLLESCTAIVCRSSISSKSSTVRSNVATRKRIAARIIFSYCSNSSLCIATAQQIESSVRHEHMRMERKWNP